MSQLIFTNNGQGLDMDKTKDKIFGFNQKFNDSPDSKGIGLYLVYKHITSLGGKISVNSPPNEWTEFVISFKE
ncbi:ATP-binding protein [uncultured Mucilaginibacter sp.]|uniref:ATP-binding protein n=1 Tax=uncultured Mucilaginibacter sp. TaxID=797541 RepID=UPI00345BBC3A